MTAEQALLQEHKKDPRVRYITRHFFKHSFVNTFWESKPIFSKHESKWIDGIRISINDFNYTFNCNDGELCILCIDDIKQEETQKSASQAPPAENENTITHFYSTRCWIEDRINYINKFIRKNIDSDLCIPTEWVEERNDLVEKLKNF